MLSLGQLGYAVHASLEGFGPYSLGSRLLAQPALLPCHLRGQVWPLRRQLARRRRDEVRKAGTFLNLCDPALIEAEKRCDVMVAIAAGDHPEDQRGILLSDVEATWPRSCL